MSRKSQSRVDLIRIQHTNCTGVDILRKHQWIERSASLTWDRGSKVIVGPGPDLVSTIRRGLPTVFRTVRQRCPSTYPIATMSLGWTVPDILVAIVNYNSRGMVHHISFDNRLLFRRRALYSTLLRHATTVGNSSGDQVAVVQKPNPLIASLKPHPLI